MSNSVKVQPPQNSRFVKVSSLPGGSFFEWDHRVYVVTSLKAYPHLAAVSLLDGGWLASDVMVEALPLGSIITVEVGQ